MTPPYRKPAFDFIAPAYDVLVKLVFGHSLRQAQAHFLSQVPKHARVLILGGGTGQILLDLLSTTQPASVLYLEASGTMLSRAKARFTNAPPSATRVEFQLGTEQAIHAPETFDVLITPFVLDLFPEDELRPLMTRLTQHLPANGLWLYTDFQLSDKKRDRLWQKLVLKAMYWFFRTVSRVPAQGLPPISQIFQELGFVPEHEASFLRAFVGAVVYRRRKGTNGSL